MNKTTNTLTIDASGKRLGRVASAAATHLMGKNRVDYVKHKSPDVRVTITNASKLVLTEAKKKDTVYKSYSGYQGGLTIRDLRHVEKKHGIKEGLRRAISGMLPNNKLRPGLMKRLTVTD